jgi:hypothetical protein
MITGWLRFSNFCAIVESWEEGLVPELFDWDEAVTAVRGVEVGSAGRGGMGVLNLEVAADGFSALPATPEGKLLGGDPKVNEGSSAASAERVPGDGVSLAVNFVREPSLKLKGLQAKGAASQVAKPEVDELGSWAPKSVGSALRSGNGEAVVLSVLSSRRGPRPLLHLQRGPMLRHAPPPQRGMQALLPLSLVVCMPKGARHPPRPPRSKLRRKD